MLVLKRSKIMALIALLIVIILIISVVFIIQNNPKPSTGPHVSSTPAPSSHPTPTMSATSPPTSSSTATSQPTQSPYLFPGEVTNYQNQSLTPVSAYINLITAHPDVAIAGTQHVDQATYHLAITGMVNNPTNYTYDEVVDNFNSTLQVATLPCVEGWSATLLWQGVPISDLLQQPGVGPNATTLIFLAADGYTTSLPLSYVTENNIMIAYKMNNVTLTPQTGFPFFLVAKNQYGYKWIEWLTEINVSNDSNYLGFWESRGYPNNATVLGSAQPLSSAQLVLPVVAISVASVAIGAAVFVSRRQVKNKQKLITPHSTLKECSASAPPS